MLLKMAVSAKHASKSASEISFTNSDSEKLEKCPTFFLHDLAIPLPEDIMQNWEKWSVISVTRLPLRSPRVGFIIMLSISVAELL